MLHTAAGYRDDDFSILICAFTDAADSGKNDFRYLLIRVIFKRLVGSWQFLVGSRFRIYGHNFHKITNARLTATHKTAPASAVLNSIIVSPPRKAGCVPQAFSISGDLVKCPFRALTEPLPVGPALMDVGDNQDVLRVQLDRIPPRFHLNMKVAA